MANLSKILLAGAVPIGTPGLSHFDRILGQRLGGRETEKTATPGPVVTFETNLAKALTALKVNITAVQSGSGDPSPTNIRPITGWTGCTISHSNGVDTPTTYSVSWQTAAGTVYGGTLDVGAGTLTVNTAFVTFYGGADEDWRQASAQPTVYFIDDADLLYITEGLDTYCKCSSYKPAGSAANVSQAYLRGNKTISFRPISSGRRIFIRNDDYTDADTFKASLSGGVELVYPIEETTYQLTPTEIETLIGTNVVTADTGDIAELKYLVKE